MEIAVLTYELIKTNVVSDCDCYVGYGIRVVACKNDIHETIYEFQDLFYSCEKAEELIDLLIRNEVSTVHILDVVEDFIG